MNNPTELNDSLEKNQNKQEAIFKSNLSHAISYYQVHY